MHLVSFLHPPFLPRYGLVWPTKHAAIWRVLSFSICWYSWLEWTNQPQVFVCTLCASVPFQTLTVVERNPVVPRPVYTPKNEPRCVKSATSQRSAGAITAPMLCTGTKHKPPALKAPTTT